MRLRNRIASLALAAAGIGTAATANAAGFYIKEQSVTGLGRAFAGEAAVAEDASTIFFNPAGMTQLPGAEAVVGAHLLVPQAQITNAGSTLGGPDSDNPYLPSVVPNGFLAYPLNSDLWVGLGVTAPFGLGSDYGAQWFGRYDSIETDLQVIDIQPSVAYRFGDMVSVGGGLDIQYAKAKLSNAIRVAGVFDIGQEVDAEDWTPGFNLGLLVKPLPTTKLGLTYRSAVTHALEGDIAFFPLTGPVPNLPIFAAGPAGADLNLPDMAAFSVAHDVTPALTLLADVTWYGWSRFQALELERPGLATTTLTQDYHDTVSVALGAQYQWNEKLKVRGGVQYDPTPTGDFRSSRTPDGDRIWVAGGVSYAVTDSIVVDAAYTHIFISEERIDVTRAQAGPALRIVGDTEGSVDVLAVGARIRF